VLGDSWAQVIQGAIRFLFAMVPRSPVVNLDEIDPAHRRAFAIEGIGDHARGRLLTVKQR
jgi:hypothetical protein